MQKQTRKAVALVSGGLDSMLAAKIIQDQGIHVEGINFYTGFCVEGHTQAIRKKDQDKIKRNNAIWVAEQLNMPLHIIDVVEEYKDVLLNPKHGYGANLNPCLDCKGFMVKKARAWMEEHGFDFIITGEVIGQRPMSQRRDTLPVIASESGANERLLRPLCAQLLPATLPEQEGWVDREKLLAFNGRNRKPQMKLAQDLGFEDYAQPAGGCCFLTDETYSRKLTDLWQARNKRDYEIDDIILLKIGRHLRPRSHFKLIISREEGETRFLEGYRSHFAHFYIASHSGPLTLIDGQLSEDDIELAARICARYSQGRNAEIVEVKFVPPGGETKTLQIKPLPSDDILQEWHV